MFRYLDYIYSVYREKSFSRAAQKLHISQSSLSCTIRRAENEIGTPIFNRNTTPVSLTEFGTLYIEKAKEIYKFKNTLENYVSDLEAGVKGRIGIGASSFFSTYLLADVIFNFRKTYPEVRIELFENITTLLRKRLDSGFIDLMITNTRMDESKYQNIFLFEDRLYIMIVPSLLPPEISPAMQTPFSAIGTPEEENYPALSLEPFCRTSFLLLHPGNNLRSCAESLMKEAHINPPILLEVNETNTLYHMAQLSMGATLLGSYVIKKVGKPEDALFFRLKGTSAKRGTYINILRNRLLTPALKQFLEELQYKCQKEK